MRSGKIHPDKFLRYWQASHIINHVSPTRKKLRILDLGAKENVLKRFCKGSDIFQLDRVCSSDAIKFAQGDAEKIPFGDRSFDWVTALDLLEHVSEPSRKRILSETRRVARSGVIFSFPSPDKSVITGEQVFDALEEKVYGKRNTFFQEHREHPAVNSDALESHLRDLFPVTRTFTDFDIHGWILSYIIEILSGIHDYSMPLRQNLYLLMNHILTRQTDVQNGYRCFLLASQNELNLNPAPPLRSLNEYELEKLINSLADDVSASFERLKKLSDYAENLQEQVKILEERIRDIGDENLRLTSDFVDLEIIYKKLEKNYRDLEIFSHKLERELSETKLSASYANQERESVLKSQERSRVERRQLVDRINAMKSTLHEQEIMITRLQKLKTDHFSDSVSSRESTE